MADHNAEMPPLAALLASHVTSISVMGGWSSRNGKESPRRYGWTCSCGVENAGRFKTDLTLDEADVGRFSHEAVELAPFLGDLVARARADVLREHADREVAHEGFTMAVERLLAHAHEHDGYLTIGADRG